MMECILKGAGLWSTLCGGCFLEFILSGEHADGSCIVVHTLKKSV